MNEPDRSPIAARYLSELDTALSRADAGVRVDLVAEVSSALHGLDEKTLIERIRHLGAPAFVAAEASRDDGPSE